MKTQTLLAPETVNAGIASTVTHARPARLDALTSLRFFAAIMVLCSHAVPVFFSSTFDKLETIPLAQGVSFFFVLSGFILTYVHPRIENMQAGVNFLRARIARVYPAHIVTALLSPAFIALPFLHLNRTTWAILLSNLLMLQSWIPQARFYFSLNAPAWSISTEFLFYLAFPFLIQNIPSRHLRNLLTGLACALACITLAAGLHLPEPSMPDSMSMRALIYVAPLARLFEFCLGMSSAVIFKKLHEKNVQSKLDVATASFLEFGIIASIAIYLLNIFDCTAFMHSDSIALAAREWLIYDGNCFAFAALIVLFAMQKGFLSKKLSGRTWLWLGETSYALYLLHFNILTYYRQHEILFAQTPPALLFVGYLAITIIAAHLMHKYIEAPMRKLIAPARQSR